MGRPKKQTVDYFPHDCEGKKTLFTLETLYGNDGYAFWFKLLELLGQTEGHCYDINKPAEKLYLFSRAKVTEEDGCKILKTLSDLEAICPVLYSEGRIWSENFVERLRGVYDKRNTGIPVKPSFRPGNEVKYGVSDTGNPQSKVKESKEEKICPAEAEPVEVIFKYWQEKHNHPRARLDGRRKKLISARIKDGYTVEDLLKAVDGCKLSPHHQGKNESGVKYDDIELICRDGKHVDMFIKAAGPDQEERGLSW